MTSRHVINELNQVLICGGLVIKKKRRKGGREEGRKGWFSPIHDLRNARRTALFPLSRLRSSIILSLCYKSPYPKT